MNDFDTIINSIDIDEAGKRIENGETVSDIARGLATPEVASVDAGAIRAVLTVSKNKVDNTLANFSAILENDPQFAGRIFYNELSGEPELLKDGKFYPWRDSFSDEAMQYIETKSNLFDVRKFNCALRICIDKHHRNPLQEKIKSIKWDGKNRIENFLSEILGCENSDYSRELSRLIFAGGILRTFEAGAKFDVVPVLIGAQGAGKSTVCRLLAMQDNFFAELSDFHGQTAQEIIQGKMIIEIPECRAISRAGAETVKSFTTALSDRFRTPYATYATDRPRRCIFIATGNDEQFLTDLTGNRRFFPITCPYSEEEATAFFKERKQFVEEYIRKCWAEAYNRYLQGNLPATAKPELSAEIKRRQEKALALPLWFEQIESYLDSFEKERVCTQQIYLEALGCGGAKITRSENLQIMAIMHKLGWVYTDNKITLSNFGRVRYWQKKG